MKYTNIKKLLIKFMGGGLVNFPTRFLRWVKIEGDTEGDDGGSGGGGGSGDNEYLFNVLELLYTPGITYNFLTTDSIYTEDGRILTKEEYQAAIVELPGNTIGDYDTANYILMCYDINEEEYTYICLTEEELNFLKEFVKTPQTITMKEYLETMIAFQYPDGYYYNGIKYPVYLPDLVFNGGEYVSTNDIPVFVLSESNFDFAYSTVPFNGTQRASVIYGFDNNLRNTGYINRVLIKHGSFTFEEEDGVFVPVPSMI